MELSENVHLRHLTKCIDKMHLSDKLTCSITVTGASEYKINGKVVKLDYYNQTLEEHNILVKAKNFLVFQGDVEAVASQSPKDLTRLIEQISGYSPSCLYLLEPA